MKSKKYLTRPYYDIKQGTVPASEYKSGKAVALLFVLDYLTHQAEGNCVSILNKTENYLKRDIKKLGVEIVVKTDGINISELKDLEIRLNLNRGNPLNEGTN